jgi:hypothetical protein
MDVEPRVSREPLPDPWRLGRAVVIKDEVDVEIPQNRSIDRLQEAPKFLTAVATKALADHAPGRHIQRGEQRGRPGPGEAARPRTASTRA